MVSLRSRIHYLVQTLREGFTVNTSLPLNLLAPPSIHRLTCRFALPYCLLSPSLRRHWRSDETSGL